MHTDRRELIGYDAKIICGGWWATLASLVFMSGRTGKLYLTEQCFVNRLDSFDMKRSTSSVPTFDSMLLPAVQALQILGGSGTTEEIYEKVVQILNVPDAVLEILRGNTRLIFTKVFWALAIINYHCLPLNCFAQNL